jgi:hypothetical protein
MALTKKPLDLRAFLLTPCFYYGNKQSHFKKLRTNQMSTDTKYDEAVAKFNQLGTSTAEDITCTYDSNKNVLIEHHKNINNGEPGRVIPFIATAASAVTMLNSAHNAWVAPDWETSKQEMPAVSLGLTLVFATMMWMGHKKIKRTIQAVDRDVQDSIQNKAQPHL